LVVGPGVAAGVEVVGLALPLSPRPDFSAGFDSGLVSGLVSEEVESPEGALLLGA
jgi:hypothetical protein